MASDRPSIQLARMLVVACGLITLVRAPFSAAQTSSTSPSTFSASPTAIGGRVVNAVTGLPVARALVRYASQAMLTDHEGRFQFNIPTSASGQPASTFIYLDVTKPGFSMTDDPMDRRAQMLQLNQITGPIELRIYPEAIITGTVISPDGEPLPRINVSVRRGMYDENSRSYRWNMTGQTQTNLHGEFRLPVPAGDYRLETRYIPRNNGAQAGLQPGAQDAVMPVTLPAPGSGDSVHQAIHMLNGQEQHFDLRPIVRRTYPVPITIESRSERGFPSITARATNGTTFNVGATINRGGPDRGPDPANDRNHTATVNLPSGSYTLSARIQDQDGVEVAETHVTVTGNPSSDSGAVLRFAATPGIPVELSIDSSATSDNASSGSTNVVGSGQSQPSSQSIIQQLGLGLQRVDPVSDEDQSFISFITPRNGGTPVFNAPPGTYRLVATGRGRWYIRSASYGSSELLGQTLVIAAGATSATMHLIVTNVTGSLAGTVNLNGAPANTAWVYLIATVPSASPVITTSINSGRFNSPNLPPGTYRAIAFERHHPVDLTDPANLQPYSSYVQTVTITAGSQAQVTLNTVPQSVSESETRK